MRRGTASNFGRVAVAAAVLLGGGAAFGTACTPDTRCDYIDRVVADSGNPTADDVAYCWQGLDLVGLYAFRFELSLDVDAGNPNVLFVVNPPSAVEPGGMEYASSWTLDEAVPDLNDAGTVSVLDLPSLGVRTQIQVTNTSLLMGTPGITNITPLRRAICTGFGFETPQKQCRGSPGRP